MKTLSLIVVITIFAYAAAQLLYSGYYLRRSKLLVQTTYTLPANLGSGPPLKLFVAGDSLGAGIGASSFETSLVGRVATDLATHHSVFLQNKSHSGERLSQLLSVPPPIDHQDIILLVISSNDLLHSTDLTSFKSAANQVIGKFSPLTDRLIIIGPGNVGSSGLIPLVAHPYFNLRRSLYVTALAKSAAKLPNVTYINPVDQPASFTSRYSQATTSTDHFHLNDEGYRWWADLIIASLNH